MPKKDQEKEVNNDLDRFKQLSWGSRIIDDMTDKFTDYCSDGNLVTFIGNLLKFIDNAQEEAVADEDELEECYGNTEVLLLEYLEIYPEDPGYTTVLCGPNT